MEMNCIFVVSKAEVTVLIYSDGMGTGVREALADLKTPVAPLRGLQWDI